MFYTLFNSNVFLNSLIIILTSGVKNITLEMSDILLEKVIVQ